jgi:hypothetical protein
MSESITISKKTPESKSQQFDFLREEGLKYIQKVAGKIWTDYNIHDPGVTILEVLAYAITELGYRASYNIEDLLENNPDNNDAADILNFFTAREILPNCPVTINDYRKLLIDVDTHNSAGGNCKHVGVKNAWIEKAKSNEIPFYVHKDESKLSYGPDPLVPGQKPLEIGFLYDILLEFEKCDEYGDLNENSLSRTLVIENHPLDTNLNGLTIKVAIEFPRWDSEDTDWGSITSVKADIHNITLRFSNHPGNYGFTFGLINNEVKLTGKQTTASDIVDVAGIAEIETRINDFIYYDPDSLLAFYLKKIKKINEIIGAVKARLHANRNLCEDFYKLSALKVEKIAVCADIELEREAEVEKVQAEIYHRIAKFLSPTVYFYTLDEMLDKCKILHELTILETDSSLQYFLVDKNLDEILFENDTVSIKDSRSNDGEYTVKSISVDKDTSTTKIYVAEDIPSELLTEGERLTFYTTDQNKCLSVDRIFEGPALDHGFIDDNELEKADRKKFIHVSDLIQIIMDVKGVVSVKTIQIANLPQDNEDGAIESKSVKWCMKLAFEQNYVPRLSLLNSKITYYKDQLPFRASSTKVEALIQELEAKERTPKLDDPVLDFEIPKGTYRDLENYESIQNDFPLTYGIGDEGIPNMGNNVAVNQRKQASAKQLKGFLMHFDQLLADYFSQLSHVKDLFSMNAQKDKFGNYIIGRTYYTQPLFDIVPNADQLYVDKNGHAVSLNSIAETDEDFFIRKNKFLDHLIGRFAEQFTDYALLTFKISGELKASEELVADKLAFLNSYPAISSARGKGFNHQETCKLWHPDNISGLRRRVSFLTGIDGSGADKLHFSPSFVILHLTGGYLVRVYDAVPDLLMKSYKLFETEVEAKLAIEKIIVLGLCKENYHLEIEQSGSNHYFTLVCDNEILAIGERENYPDSNPGGELDMDIDKLVKVFKNEFYNNPESNRNNLACPLLNYIEYSIAVDMAQNPPVAIVSYGLYSKPFSTNAADKLIAGEYIVEGENKQEVDIISVDTVLKKIVIDGNIAVKLAAGNVLVIADSQGNDGVYTVVSATDIGANTEIVVDEPIPSDTTPLGELLYNIETEAELLMKAQEQLPEILWQLIDNASQNGKYYFSHESGAYRFRIFNNAGIDLAESVGADFNDPLAVEIANLKSGSIKVSGSTGNDGTYDVLSAAASNDEVTITLTTNLPSTTADGDVSFTETFAYTASKEENSFTIQTDLSAYLFKGDKIKVSGSGSVDGEYTVFSIAAIGPETVILAEEPVPSDDDTGSFSYSKSFKIEKITTNKITFKGGAELRAVNLFIDFITSKFFSNEGFHVLEHVLLRPKAKGQYFVDAAAGTLTEGLPDLGSLYFSKTLPLFSASNITNGFKVDGDLSSDLDASETTDISSEFTISDTGANDAVYKVKNVSFDPVANRTTIKPVGKIHSEISHFTPFGNISFLKGTLITSVSATNLSITVSEAGTLNIKPGDIVEIRGSTNKVNDARYLAKEVIENGSSQEIVIGRVESGIEDSLLEIVLDENKCDDCQITDPYTCVASVIVPHWQGRFDNMDFRRFFEKQLRLEAPAHVFLVICWISCEQMTEFELKYKAWLIENAKQHKDFGSLSARLNELIDIRNQLRNVYPTGTLHDCEEDETLENAIILDNSAIGNA